MVRGNKTSKVILGISRDTDWVSNRTSIYRSNIDSLSYQL